MDCRRALACIVAAAAVLSSAAAGAGDALKVTLSKEQTAELIRIPGARP